MRTLNYDLTAIGDERRLQLSELEEIKSKAYESARLSQERSKLVHEKMIVRKDFALGMKVLLYDLRLHLFPGKLRSRKTGPFVVTHAFSYGLVEIQDPTTGAKQKVNGQRLKQFLELHTEEDVECLMLMNHPVITDGWRGSLGTFSLQPGSIVLSLVYGVYGILYFLLFCLTLPFRTMRTLCNLGAGAGKLCFKILKEKIFF